MLRTSAVLCASHSMSLNLAPLAASAAGTCNLLCVTVGILDVRLCILCTDLLGQVGLLLWHSKGGG